MDATAPGNLFAGVRKKARVVVVSNRQPWFHKRLADGIRAYRPASGPVTALEPIIEAVGGTWIAHGSASADRMVVDWKNRVCLPEQNPQCVTLRFFDFDGTISGFISRSAEAEIHPACRDLLRDLAALSLHCVAGASICFLSFQTCRPLSSPR
jgi:trehalose-6-phosphate synthase